MSSSPEAGCARRETVPPLNKSATPPKAISQLLCIKMILPMLLTALPAMGSDVPAGPIAQKGNLLFSDDFSHPELYTLIPTFKIVDGALEGSQTRDWHGAASSIRVAVTPKLIRLGDAKGSGHVTLFPLFRCGLTGRRCC